MLNTLYTTANAGFQIILLVVLFFYCWFVWRYRKAAVSSLKSVGTMKTEEVPAGFLISAMIAVAVATGIAVVKAGWLSPPEALLDPISGISGTRGTQGIFGFSGTRGFLGFSGFSGIPGIPAVGLVAGTALVVACVELFQLGVLKAAGRLVFAGEFTDDLIRTKKTYLAAAAVMVIPPILVVSGNNPVMDEILTYIVGTEIITTALMFAGRTLILFMRQKCSLLVWFLYLCTVEIFPVSLAILLAAKSV
jgi:hypothetical protein